MKWLCLLLALCLTLCGCSAPAEAPEPAEGPQEERSEDSGLTAEEAREALAQALLEQTPGFLAYDPETGFDAGDLHYVWSDKFWPGEEVLEDRVEGTEIYCFDLVFGSDADGGLEDVGNPMAGRLRASYGIGKDGGSLWQYRQDLGEWEALPEFESETENGKE